MPFKELLDPEGWENVLDAYARTVNLSVAMFDHEGRLIGTCHNAKPVWRLARAARPDWGAGCMFCLDSDARCTAASDAQRTRAPTLSTDSGGFVHVAVPLYLGDRHLGTILAGQVFDRYPELLLLEKVARQFHLSPQELWDLARRQVPISRSSLIVYGNLLGTLSHAFVRERYAVTLQRNLTDANQQLVVLTQHLEAANLELASQVGKLADASVEKDILLTEVHHRVNNNLAVIASLLRMQAESSPDGEMAIALRASQFRVESMALVHAQLYDSEDWRAVDFAEYAATLGGNLFRSFGVNEARIALRVEIGQFELGVDKAIPAGLILNELISNALKHAFPGDRSGTILVQGGLHDGRVELSVHDDGVGKLEPTEHRKRQSLGLKIVNILCQQLKGTLTQTQDADQRGAGSAFRLSFPHETRS